MLFINPGNQSGKVIFEIRVWLTIVTVGSRHKTKPDFSYVFL